MADEGGVNAVADEGGVNGPEGSVRDAVGQRLSGGHDGGGVDHGSVEEAVAQDDGGVSFASLAAGAGHGGAPVVVAGRPVHEGVAVVAVVAVHHAGVGGGFRLGLATFASGAGDGQAVHVVAPA